jgi:hypothetical protein
MSNPSNSSAPQTHNELVLEIQSLLSNDRTETESPNDNVEGEVSVEADSIDAAATVAEVVATDDAPEAEQPVSPSAVEEFYVTDETGRKKLMIDFSDKEQLKKYVQMAHGGRKWKSDKDKAESELKKLQSDWQSLESVYSDKGIEGLVNFLAKDEQAYSKHLNAQLERAKFKEKASPAQIEQLELMEKLERAEKERAKLEKQLKDDLDKRQAEREQSEKQALEAKLHPVFDKYRFAGKLGNEEAEEEFDKAVWTRAISSLQTVEGELTPAVVDNAFKKASGLYRDYLNKQAEAGVKKAIETKKVQAQQAVVGRAMKPLQQKNSDDDLRKEIAGGGLAGALERMLTGTNRRK